MIGTEAFIILWLVASACFLLCGFALLRQLKKIEALMKDLNIDLATVARETQKLGGYNDRR